MTALTNQIRTELCKKKKKNPTFSQSQLSRWLKETYEISVSQMTVSKILKRSSEFLSQPGRINPNVMRQGQTRFPLMGTALIEWFHLYEERIPMSEDIIKQKGSLFWVAFIQTKALNFQMDGCNHLKIDTIFLEPDVLGRVGLLIWMLLL